MTLLSNIFRANNTITEEGKKIEITIRSLSVPELAESPDELTLDAVFAERDRLLDEAKLMMEQEKASIEQMRQIASEDIASMQAAWQDEKPLLQQQAYDEGFQVGYEEGRNKVLSDMADSIRNANEVTGLSYGNARKYLESQERVILELAIRTAERIMGQMLQEDQESYLSLIKRALKEAREMKEIKLYVSLDYFELVSANRTELASIFPPDIPFLIFVNEDFNATDCMIETNHGRIVVSIDEQLNKLRSKLVEIMESGE
jgi:flagellar assembly protein FliH